MSDETFLFISFTSMRRFFQPNDDSSISTGHYLVALAAVLVSLFFVGPVAMSYFASISVRQTLEPTSFSTLQQQLSSNSFLVMNLIPFILGFICLIVVAKVVLKRSFKSMMTSRTQIDWRRIAFAFFSWLAIFVIAEVIRQLIFGTNLQLNFDSSRFWILLLIAVTLVPIQTGFEEIFFRGLLLQLLGRLTSKPWLILIVIALLFGAMHSMNPEMDRLGFLAMVFYLTSGLFTTTLVLMDEGIELAWGFHFANNFFSLVLVSTSWQALQTDSIWIDTNQHNLVVELIITLAICYPLFLWLCKKRFKWGSWKSKLINQASL